MGELVQDRVVPPRVVVLGDLGTEEVFVSEGDAARVLHGAGVVLGQEELIVGVEGVFASECLFVDLEAPLSGGAHLLGLQVACHRLAAHEVGGHDTLDRRDLTGVHMELARHQCGDVAGDRRGGREMPGGEAIAARLVLGGSRVGVDLPVLGCLDGQLEGGFEIRLVEAAVHAARIGGFELGVEVDLAVGGIDEAVQALTGAGVAAQRGDGQLMLAAGQIEGEPEAIVGVRGQLDAVQPGIDDLVGDQIEPAVARLAGELHGRGGDEGGGRICERLVVQSASGEVDGDAVGMVGDELGPLLCFIPRDVHRTGHGAFQSLSVRRIRAPGLVPGLGSHRPH